jgi:hypothetical protein
MKKFRRYMSIAVLIVVAVGAVLLLTPIGERPLAAVFAVGDVETVDFAAPALSDKPNWFLMCPPDLCGAGPHTDSPLFDVPVERLRARWREVATAEPGDDILAEHGDGWQFDYVQRSARFRYPDIVTVRFIAASATQSTLAIYSRSIYGGRDCHNELPVLGG